MVFWRSYAHLVWSTKNRDPLIRPEIEPVLYGVLKGAAGELECYVHAIGGIADHIHIVISIPPKHSVAWVVKHLKGTSSHAMNHVLTPEGPHFAWQRGYGYLSLGEKQRTGAIAYVLNQKEHHSAKTTNAWLERSEEGQTEMGSDFSQFREPTARYEPGEDTII